MHAVVLIWQSEQLVGVLPSHGSLVLNPAHKTWQSAPLPVGHLAGLQVEAVLDNSLLIFYSFPCPFSHFVAQTEPYT